MSAVSRSPSWSSSPHSIMQASKELERIPSVSYSHWHHLFSAFVNDLQTQDFGIGLFPNARNVIINGGTFVSHSHRLHISSIIMHIVFTRSTALAFLLLILVKGGWRPLYPANQIPVHCLLDGKMCLTSLGRFLFVLIVVAWRRGTLVFCGEQEGLERPKSVSNS